MDPIPSQIQQNQVSTQDDLVNKPVEKETLFELLKSSLFEFFLVVIFTILILTTFNYFNLIPLSSVFPNLSFLPQQEIKHQNSYNSGSSTQSDSVFFDNNLKILSGCNPIPEKDIFLNVIIKCDLPMQDFNSGKDTAYNFVPNSDFIPSFDSSLTKQLQINFALKILPHKGYQQSGIMFGDDINRIFIGYNLSSSSWEIAFLYGKRYLPANPLYIASPSPIERANFSITVSEDGKTIAIMLPNGTVRIFNLEQSLYTTSGNIPSTLVVDPGSEVDLMSLNYLTL